MTQREWEKQRLGLEMIACYNDKIILANNGAIGMLAREMSLIEWACQQTAVEVGRRVDQSIILLVNVGKSGEECPWAAN